MSPRPRYMNNKMTPAADWASAVGLFFTALFFVPILALVIIGVIALPGGWVLMLAFGVLHSYIHQVPAIGYWSSVGMAALIVGLRQLLFASAKVTKNDDN